MPVVAELRVFPHAEGAPRRDKPGQWAGEGLRAEVADLVPPGGLTGTILRRVSLWRHREQLREILAYLEAERGEAALRQALGRPGLERQALAARPRPGGRRRRWSDTDYARIAAAYEQAVAAGSRRPAAEVARTITLPGAARPLTARQVADLAHRARERGLLTYPHKQGASGGRLTDKARALLGLDTSGQPPAAPTPTKARRHGRGK
ncbi:MAG TPA: hypothetical protein VF406_12880 [Thermodesulfobacteriota bacterium]